MISKYRKYHWCSSCVTLEVVVVHYYAQVITQMISIIDGQTLRRVDISEVTSEMRRYSLLPHKSNENLQHSKQERYPAK